MTATDARGRWIRALVTGISIGVVTGWLGMPGEPMATAIGVGAAVGLVVGLLAGAVSRRWG